MMNIGVIGLGGAGGNIANEASKLGFLTGAINFSQNDLDEADVRYKLRLSGSEGVGKNRELAIQLFNEQWEIALRWVQDNFSNVDALILAASSSGGSGSGILPILSEILANVMSEKVISAFVVLPDLSEAPVSQQNCLNTLEELSKLNISIFPIDNQQGKNKFVAKNKIFEFTNRKSIELLHIIALYTEKTSKNGNFDKRDFLTVLGTGGIASISEIEIATLSKNVTLSQEWISEQINESWISGVFVPVETKKVTRAALIFDGQEGLLEYINHEKIFDFFDNGIIDLFEGNYHEHNGKLVTILTGLEWCNSRLQDIEKSLEMKRDNVESVLSKQNHYQSKSSMDFLNKLRKQPEKKQSVLDILSKYTR